MKEHSLERKRRTKLNCSSKRIKGEENVGGERRGKRDRMFLLRYTISFRERKRRSSSYRTVTREHASTRVCCQRTPRRENYQEREDLRALTDAEHALTSVAAFCHFYGPRVPKIWPLSTAKRNTLVSKTRKHDTTDRASVRRTNGESYYTALL